jgi:hypothetical protein
MFQVRFVQRALLAMCLMVSVAQTFATAALDAAPTEPVNAIWKLQRVEFNFRSTSTYYSCDGLRHKIAGIMKAVGARDGVNIDLRCRPGGLVNDAWTLITFAAPIEATPENVTAATTYSTETQLAARLNKVQLPTATDIHRFQAVWRTVELNRKYHLNLSAGDCELLHALVDQVFPHLPLRVTKRRLNCGMGGDSHVRPIVHVAALVPAPVVPMAYAPAGGN